MQEHKKLFETGVEAQKRRRNTAQYEHKSPNFGAETESVVTQEENRQPNVGIAPQAPGDRMIDGQGRIIPNLNRQQRLSHGSRSSLSPRGSQKSRVTESPKPANLIIA